MAERELETWWAHIEREVKARGFLVYPLGEALELPEAPWQAERVEPFLELAALLGVRLVYTSARRFDADDFAALSEEETTPEIARLIAAIKPHVGHLRDTEVGWVYEGVYHVDRRIAGWYERVAEELPARQAEGHQAERARLRALADEIARDPAFGQARGGEEGRRFVIQMRYPELQPGEVGYVAMFAQATYLNLVLPERERELLARVRPLLAGGWSETAAAREVGLTRDRLRSLLLRYPE